MTTIDHAAKARKLETNAWARGGIDGEALIRRPEERRDIIASAQVHATLALVEQQRIANIIALSVPQGIPGQDDGAKICVPSFGNDLQLRDDIKKGLGL